MHFAGRSRPQQWIIGECTLSTPQPRSEEQSDNYHGETVADPFRWAQDTSSEQTRGL